MTPTFKAPTYSKIVSPKSGVLEPCYTFQVVFSETDEPLSFVAETQADISLKSLQACVVENLTWWNGFLTQFLQASAKLLSKSYTTDNINKIAVNTLTGTATESFPCTVMVQPKTIQISSSGFTVNWEYKTEAVIINIPVFELPDPEEKQANDGMEELDINEIPDGENATGAALEIDSPAKFYDKQRVKEARLKAKLALYKAQRQMTEYFQKYGDDISDSDTESEYSSSDGEEDAEDVQL